MAATIQQIVDYAASIAPANWSDIIRAADFKDDIVENTFRVINSVKRVKGTKRNDVFCHGKITDRIWASNLYGMQIGVDELIDLQAEYTLEKNGRKMCIYVTWYPNNWYSVKIVVHVK
jgi:hypothetical protein